MKRHLYLIGYRGCGKTSVARLLAQTLDSDWVDTDVLIESLSKRSIRDIFASDGEEVFRDLESQAVDLVSRQAPQVVALGGGAIFRANNRLRIAESGLAVWLQAAPEILAARICGDPQTAERRPSLTGQSVVDEIREVLQRRLPCYEQCATFTVDTNDLTPAAVTDQIRDWWAEINFG